MSVHHSKAQVDAHIEWQLRLPQHTIKADAPPADVPGDPVWQQENAILAGGPLGVAEKLASLGLADSHQGMLEAKPWCRRDTGPNYLSWKGSMGEGGSIRTSLSEPGLKWAMLGPRCCS